MIKKLVLLTVTILWVCLWYILIASCLFQIYHGSAPMWGKWAMTFGVFGSVSWFTVQMVWLTYVYVDKRMK